MNEQDAFEQAYKNGYEKGQEDALKEHTSHWVISSDGYYPYCAACKQEPQSGYITEYCPHCGRRMIENKED